MASASHNALDVDDLMLVAPFSSDNRDGRGAWRTLAGVDNLLQAIWLRLNTAEGTLTDLGHPEYGSRLYLLIGQLDVPETHERARLYIARALSREPRIGESLSISVASDPSGSGRTLTASIGVRAIDHRDALHFGFSIVLEPTP